MSFVNESVVLMQDCYSKSTNALSRWHLPFNYPLEFQSARIVHTVGDCGIESIPHEATQVWGQRGYLYSDNTGSLLILLKGNLLKAISAVVQLPLEVLQQLPVQVVQAYLPALSHTKPGYIRYLARPEHLKEDRWTIVKAGRFLRRHCRHLSDEDVKQLTAIITGSCTEYTLKFTAAGDADTIADVYRHGPSSCQSGYKPYMHGGIQVDGEFYAPVRIYAHPDNNLRLAYLENSDGRYVARAWVNIQNMTYNTVYASSDTFTHADSVMHEYLSDLGYTADGDACMRGELLLRVETDCGAIICPYIDPSNMGVDIQDDHLEIGGGHEANYETGCLHDYDLAGNTQCCDRCDNRYHEDDLRYVEDVQGTVCEECLDEDFVWARVDSYRVYDWVHTDNVVELVDGDFVHVSEIHNGEYVCIEWGDHQGEYCKEVDAVCCEERGWCYIPDVQDADMHYCKSCDTLMHPDEEDECPECGSENHYKV